MLVWGSYDAEGRILTVDGGSTSNYVYNENGQRVRKYTSSEWVEYFYSPDGNVQSEYNGSWLTHYVYAGSRLLALYQDNTTDFVHPDQLGSTRLVTSVSKGIVDNTDYETYGRQTTGATGTSHKFTGKELDTESGLDYFGARYRGPIQGRFMSPDWSDKPEAVPYADLENPQSLNLYSYAGNNPLVRDDPDGHFWQQLWNWLNGECWCTNEQITEQHRTWLLEHVVTNDADAKKVQNAAPQQVDDTYACLHSASCTQDYRQQFKDAAAAAASKMRFGNNPNQDNHTFRHVEDEGIDKQAAEKAIREDLAGKEDSLPQGLTKGRVNVGGKTLEYNAYKLPDGTINVGRITVY